MKRKSLNLILTTVVLIFFIGCVPMRKYTEMKTSKEATSAENIDLQKKVDGLNANNKELNTSLDTQNKQLKKLQEDTTLYGKEYRRIRNMYDKVNDLNNELLAKNE
ncbi:MAG: hypothetical protein ACKO7P_12165, partial [Bacteroidota bacterium]